MKFTTDIVTRFWRTSAALLAALFSCTVITSAAWAQEDAAADADDANDVIEQITVTGTRIKRDSTFNSTSPLAVIDTDEAFQFGNIDAASMLRQSTSVSGQQIDSSFSGFTVDGGPGAETVALRGLGPERTLVLMDGRRLGAAGTFGAAVNTDLSLIPTFLINRAEILLSGASSIYGADAVAGVVNIITPRDFDGVQFDVTLGEPSNGHGQERVATLQFGGSSDRSRFFLGAEYYERDGVRAADQGFTSGGHRSITIDDDGNRVEDPDGFFDQTVAFGPDCFFAGYTPGEMGGGSTVPDYSCDTDFDEPPWDNAFFALDQHIWSPSQKWAGFASFEYDLGQSDDHTFFFQLLNSSRTQAAHGGDGQFFPLVPDTNNFNPFGAGVVPVAFDGDARSDVDDTKVNYERYVTGFYGNLPFLNIGSLNNWTYEGSLGYTNSKGSNNFDIVRNDRLTNSLNNCSNTSQDLFGGFAPECVAVDLFGEAFMTTGSLGDAQEYLVARVTNVTTVEQTAFEVGATGDLFDLPAGPLGMFIGASYREDKLFSNVDQNIEESNAWGRSAEGDTRGSVNINEVYVELDVPLLADRKMAHDVGINASYRLSDDEFFGTADTWRVTAYWDFTENFRLRGTAGTSFRAPNLKELFIADQTGFEGAFIDPCIPPPNDDRSQIIIDNCISEGVDPFTLGANGAPSVPSVSGGADDLRPETSDSWSVGAVFTQPWSDSFDLQISIDLTNLEITDAVAEPSAGFVLNQCYTSPGFSDPLCGRVTRNLDAVPDQRFLLLVDESVANIEVENYEDLSFSTFFATEFGSTTLTWNADFTKTLEYEKGLFAETSDKLVGSIGVPEWRIYSTARLAFGDWSVSHRLTYFSEGEDTEAQRIDGGLADNEVAFIGDFSSHSFSLSYTRDSWSAFLTIENAFDEQPDLIHDDAFVGNTINNMPLGVYPAEAIMGRAVVVSFSKSIE
ncbi:MAG: TonB-dependent receptor plug domain-containing protein [Woeseiaceae bacterium]